MCAMSRASDESDDGADERAPGRPGGIHRAPLALVGLLTLVVGIGGGAGVYFAGEEATDSVNRIEISPEVLAANDGPAENYLIVGSDSRAGLDVDATGAEDAAEVTGSRSDSIMILRRDPEFGASLLSIPRDLWVPIAGDDRDGKINSAFNGSASQLAQTITQSLGIPINHYIEIDFDGFSRLVDTFGGIDICLDNAGQDLSTGLSIPGGCQTLAGPQALAFVRSRHYEEWIESEGNWVPDNQNDLGRIARQQMFLRAAAADGLEAVNDNPFLLGNMLDATQELVSFDQDLDLIDAADSLRAAFSEGLRTFQLPVTELIVEDQSALELVDGADVILAYFSGTGPMPPEPPTETTASDD